MSASCYSKQHKKYKIRRKTFQTEIKVEIWRKNEIYLRYTRQTTIDLWSDILLRGLLFNGIPLFKCLCDNLYTCVKRQVSFTVHW